MDALFCPDRVIWGDVATWVTGVGTLAAVGVALALATKSDRQTLAIKKTSAQLLAISILPEIGQLRVGLPSIRRMLSALTEVAAAEWNWHTLSAMILSLDTPLLHDSADKIVYFEGDCAKFLASTLGNLFLLRSTAQPWGRNADDMAPNAQNLVEPLLVLCANLQKYVDGAHERLWVVAGIPDAYPADVDTKLSPKEIELLRAFDERGGTKPNAE